MQLKVGTEFIGLDSVLARTDRLGRLLASPYVREGLRQGAELLRREGQSKLSTLLKGYQTGRLMRSADTLTKRGYSLAGFRRGKGGGNHSHLVDRGTTHRYTRKGAYRGTMPSNLFWTSTRQTHARRAGDKVIRGLQIALQQV